ncbi:hypothetical protein CHS0354_030091 [Potamilus streckersoni]|uniref:Thiamine diphosphokinase n=1 Tax=Potamilus streckersoni TaxID=2493646 RepID=A0AAE0VE00_9BIVA|nr:hypothetical protein CHS0354_030091 [Potamilus streckersoni]
MDNTPHPRFLIILNGQLPSRKIIERLWSLCDTKICADGAYDKLLATGFKELPDAVIGDGDSISTEFRQQLGSCFIEAWDQNKTDSEKCLEYALAKGVKSVDIIGGDGLLNDHFLYNLSLMRRFSDRLSVSMQNDYDIIFYRSRPFSVQTGTGVRISLMPIYESVQIGQAEGLRYSVTGKTLSADGLMSISNESKSSREACLYFYGISLLQIKLMSASPSFSETAVLWADTHCHLDMLKPTAEDCIRASIALDTPVMVTIGTDHESNCFINDITQKIPHVYGTLGYHPHDADKFQPEHLDYIREQLRKNPKIIGIGECGFDFYYTRSTPENQKRVFEIMMNFALETDYPLAVHTRDSEDATQDLMRPFLKKGLRALLHSYTSNEKLADFAIEHGCWFSFNGIATYKKSEYIRHVMKKIPRDKILLETDAPFLAPEPFRGKQNIPGYVGRVGALLAKHLDITEAEFAALTWKNAKAFYKNFNPDLSAAHIILFMKTATVLLFSVLKDRVGKPSIEIILPEKLNAAELIARTVSEYPQIKDLQALIKVSVNRKYIKQDEFFSPDAEIALLPPVSGG